MLFLDGGGTARGWIEGFDFSQDLGEIARSINDYPYLSDILDHPENEQMRQEALAYYQDASVRLQAMMVELQKRNWAFLLDDRSWTLSHSICNIVHLQYIPNSCKLKGLGCLVWVTSNITAYL